MNELINNPIYQVIVGGLASGYWFIKWISTKFDDIKLKFDSMDKKIDKLMNSDTCKIARAACNNRFGQIEKRLLKDDADEN
jgi:hypothetical protein